MIVVMVYTCHPAAPFAFWLPHAAGRVSPTSPVPTSAVVVNRLCEPTIASLSLQAKGAASDVYLAASFPLTPSPWSRGGKLAKDVCLCPLPTGEMVLQAHVKVMNLHGCYSETRINPCSNYYCESGAAGYQSSIQALSTSSSAFFKSVFSEG